MCPATLALKGHQGQAAEDTCHHPSGQGKLLYKRKATPTQFPACCRGAPGLSCPSAALLSSASQQTPHGPARASPHSVSRPGQPGRAG